MKKESVVARGKRSLWRDFCLQWSVIHALVVREVHTRYGRDDLGFLWVLGEPLLFCGGVAIAWTAVRPAQEHGLPMAAMVVTGYVPLTMYRHCVGRATKAFEANASLLFHRQVTPIDIIMARSWLEIIGTIMAGLLVYTVGVATGYINSPEIPLLIYVGMIYQALFSIGLALVIASLTESSELMEKFMNVFMYLTLPLTGAFAMSEWLPPTFRTILLFSPCAENIEMIRGGQFGMTSHPHYSFPINTALTLGLLIWGYYLTLRVRKHIFIQ